MHANEVPDVNGHRWLRMPAWTALMICGATMACHAGKPAAVQPSAPTRDVHLELDVSLAWVKYAIDIHSPGDDGRVVGAMKVQTAAENRAHVERQFGCVTRAIEPQYETPMWECAPAFHRRAPNWAGMLRELDSLGIMAPPRDSQPDAHGWRMICNDGAPWAIEVRTEGAVVVRDAQVCGPRSERRRAYENGIDSVFSRIITAAGAR